VEKNGEGVAVRVKMIVTTEKGRVVKTEGVYLTDVCPRLRGKPLLWWTAGAQQTWQACVGNGFFLGSLYVYTGPQQ
jgi:hypothetical protein